MLSKEQFQKIESQMEAKIRAFIELVLQMYGSIEIMSIRAVKSDYRRAYIHGKAQSVKEAIKIIKDANLIWKNAQYPVDVYYRPLSTEYKYLFFDFDTEPARSTLENAYLILNTSFKHYHIYYQLEKPLNEVEYKKAVKALMVEATEIKGADPACSNANHWRRLGGFYNKKAKPFMMNFVKGINVKIPAGVIEESIRRVEEVHKEQKFDQDTALLWLSENADKKFINAKLKVISYKNYIRNSKKEDKSSNDASYAIYALSRGASVKEVEQAILAGRGEELIKKHKRVWNYLARTLQFALNSLSIAKDIVQNQQQIREVRTR